MVRQSGDKSGTQRPSSFLHIAAPFPSLLASALQSMFVEHSAPDAGTEPSAALVDTLKSSSPSNALQPIAAIAMTMLHNLESTPKQRDRILKTTSCARVQSGDDAS